jgi:hypothetical protein
MSRKALTPLVGPPSPVIPFGVLLVVVLTPCVAVAVTRFGGRAR